MAPSQGSLDLRVEDYLDDKLQSTTDLDLLPTLAAQVESQRDLLRSQLSDARAALASAQRTSADRQKSVGAKMAAFQDLQSGIDARLLVVQESDAPNRAVARLQGPYRKRRAVRSARRYLELLREVEELRTAARSRLPADPRAALEPYGALRKLGMALRDRQEAADDAGVHLVTHVTVATDTLWTDMKTVMSREMESVLRARGWPNEVDADEGDMDDEWIACFEKLLELQLPELQYTEEVVSLLPFDVMSAIFVTEFRYHFLSDRPTSDPDAMTTHCFPWFMACIHKWEAFFRDNLGPFLADKLRGTPAAECLVYVDPVCAFIRSMLPIMREKVRAVAGEVVSTPMSLSRFVGDVMDFDDSVRSDFNYDGGDPAGWSGLTSELLDNWFERWFTAERAFAMDRFRDIVESADRRKIDFDYGGEGKTKPTYGAVQVTDLLKSITSQYRRVLKFKHKIRFLVNIQIDILDEFHDRLRDSLQAYGAITSTVGRTLHGVTKEQQSALEGTGGLETLCKVLGSADHIINTLKDWSNEEFFIEFYAELLARSKGHAKQASLGGMTMEQVQDRTSAAVGSRSDEGGMFDETIAAYTARRKAAQEYLVTTLVDSHSKAFRVYINRAHWTLIAPDTADNDPSMLAVTPELDEPLRVLKRNMDYSIRALGTAVLRRVWRLTLDRLQESLWTEILMRQSFTHLGAAQFARDMDALCTVAEMNISGGSTHFSNIQEGLRLLGLPVSKTGSEGGMTLSEASDRVFTDNSEAKAVLDELGIENLTPANARHILQRRVENNE